MRLPMKPSHTPVTTPTLFKRFARASTVARTSLAVAAPRTISSSFITCAGLKKCMPTTSSGRRVNVAMALTSSVDVLVASTAPGFAVRSMACQACCFAAMSSNTASTTTSAAATSGWPCPLTGWIDDRRSSAWASVSFPFLTLLS